MSFRCKLVKNNPMKLLELIILGASILGALTAIYFFFKSSFQPNLWLSLLLIVASYNFFYNVLFWTEFNKEAAIQLKRSHLFPMSLYGPLLFLYVQSLVNNTKFKWTMLAHFIPFVLVLISLWGFYTLSIEDKIVATQSFENLAEYTFYIPGLDWFFCFHMLVYTIASYQITKKKILKDDDLLIWLKVVHTIFGVFVVAFFAYYFLAYIGQITNEKDHIISIIMLIFLVTTLYFSYQYPDIFNGKPVHKVIPFVKYQRAGLSSEFSFELKEKLSDLMEDKKPYLETTLRLNDISELLNVSRNHTSQVINEHFKCSFFDFINQYRVDEAIALLEDSTKRHLSINEIAFLSGFNNRVSFYNAFKKRTGITPTDYRRDSAMVS